MNNKILIKDFEILKKPRSFQEHFSNTININNGGYLIAISSFDINNSNVLNKLMTWRNSANYAYYNSPEATIESTEKWLESLIYSSEKKILFKIFDENNEFIGHLGLNINSKNDFIHVELDNILRGSDKARKGIITDSILSLVQWCKNIYFIEKFLLRVLSTNENAINFYKKLGFIETERVLNDDKKTHMIEMTFQNTSYTNKNMILTAGPSIGIRERIYSSDATINGWNAEWKFYLSKFEKEFAKYIGVKYAIATSSCTGSMHIALSALDIKKGDEVIVPDITWVSTANAVMLVGATPIFADVDLNTWTLDPNSVESLISDRTKAIMPVHLYGHPAEMDKIMSLAKKYNLKIIEDAAPSIGAEFYDQKTGSFGDFSAFSFQGAKLLVTGEGGMLCTNDKSLYERAYKIWDQGRVPGTFWIEELSSKYKMANIQAAIGLGQLERNDLMVNKKRLINDWYFERLKNIKGISFFRESDKVKSICWMSCIRLNEDTKLSRDNFCKELKKRNVDTRPVFPTISQYPYWELRQAEQPNSKLIANTGVNLPSGVCLSKEEVNYICDQIIETIKWNQ